MKKMLCVVTVALFSTVVLYGQEATFGVKAGLNIAGVKVDEGEDFDNKIAIHFGGLAHIHFSRHFAFQPEIVYSAQGGKDDDNDFKLKLNYINIPLLAQYMTLDGFRFQTGPQLGFLVSAKTKTEDVEVDIKDDLETFDFSWSFGAGYLFPQGLGIDIRYNLGITNVSEDEDFEARNRVFQIGVFYQFMKHKRSRR